MRDRLLLHEEPRLPEARDHVKPCGVAVGAGEHARRGRHAPCLVDDGEHGQPVSLADLEVGRVVARRDLQRAGAERRIYGLVRDDGHAPLRDRDEDVLADVALPALVVGVHGDGDVGHDRLGACGRDDQVGRARGGAGGPRVLHVGERVRPLDVLRLEVGVRRLAGEAPVDDAIRAVEVALLVEPDEVRAHGALLRRLHREVRPRPVERAAEHPELTLDARPVVVHPLPHLGEELLARKAALLGQALLRELFLDDDLGDDPGVVGPRHVEGRLAAHAVPARHEVLIAAERQRVPEVQIACDVRERQHHHERTHARRILLRRREEAGALPPLVEVALDDGRVPVLARVAESTSRSVGRHRAPPS